MHKSNSLSDAVDRVQAGWRCVSVFSSPAPSGTFIPVGDSPPLGAGPCGRGTEGEMGFEREQKDTARRTSDQLGASHQKAITFLADSMPQTPVHKQEEQPARKTWTGQPKPGDGPGRPVSSPPEPASGRRVAGLVVSRGCLQSGAATPTRKLLHRRLTASSPPPWRFHVLLGILLLAGMARANCVCDLPGVAIGGGQRGA